MGLAATRVKQRFGLDPRNTAWSNDTNKFGHIMLEKYGWKPGMGLGSTPHKSSKTHIRVSIKDDNLGLGARSQNPRDKDGFDRECTGLDDFQRLLGKLNGKEEMISRELDRQRSDRIIDGKWGVHFVKGEVLSSTWDPCTMKLKDYSNKDENEKKKVIEEVEDERKRKKQKVGKKERKKKKEEKKEKKEKKGKQKMERKEKKRKSPRPELTRLSARSKYIKQKRAATMDPRALNEIFMITQ